MTRSQKTLPNSGGCKMAEQKLYKAGDQFVMPVTFQVLKTLGHEDRVFHICAPVDDVKRVVALKDPFFIVCTEQYQHDEAPKISMGALQRAYDFANLEGQGSDSPDFEDDSAGGSDE